jgi:hypothetical protein
MEVTETIFAEEQAVALSSHYGDAYYRIPASEWHPSDNNKQGSAWNPIRAMIGHATDAEGRGKALRWGAGRRRLCGRICARREEQR